MYARMFVRACMCVGTVRAHVRMCGAYYDDLFVMMVR